MDFLILYFSVTSLLLSFTHSPPSALLSPSQHLLFYVFSTLKTRAIPEIAPRAEAHGKGVRGHCQLSSIRRILSAGRLQPLLCQPQQSPNDFAKTTRTPINGSILRIGKQTAGLKQPASGSLFSLVNPTPHPTTHTSLSLHQPPLLSLILMAPSVSENTL